jgi:SAM-dependent methyltransferase
MDAAGYESFIRDEEDHFWFIGRRAIFADLLAHCVPPLDTDAFVVDLGCGVGGMLELLSHLGTPVGMDISAGILTLCRDRGFPSVFVGRGHRLPLRSGIIDLVALFDVLEHIPEERETLAECMRILKPGGWLLFSGPSYQFLYTHQDRQVDHQRRYTVRALRHRFSQAGFDVVRSSYINCLLFPVILPLLLARKLREWIVPPGSGESRLNTEIRIPRPLNALCARIFSVERFFLRRASLPFGHSLILLARKPSGRDLS